MVADTLIESIQKSLDPILSVRDILGAQKHNVFLLKRTKSASNPELDEFNSIDPVDEIEKQILPSPRIVDYSHDKRLREGGNIKQGDLLLKMISKNSFPSRDEIECITPSKNIERYYYINDDLYNVVSVTEDYVWWNVQIRKATNKTIYL